MNEENKGSKAGAVIGIAICLFVTLLLLRIIAPDVQMAHDLALIGAIVVVIWALVQPSY